MSNYIRDCEGPLYVETEGTFRRLTEEGKAVSCLVTPVADVTTIAELVESCGYSYKSVIGKRVYILIEELT